MILADSTTELEMLKSLSQNWPLLAVIVSAIAWFAKYIAHPLTTRHISWMDAMEERDKERLASDVDHKHTLADVREKVITLNDTTNTIKDIIQKFPVGQPRGGV
jgi:hypothetical protein